MYEPNAARLERVAERDGARPGSHGGARRSAALAPHERERALRCCRWSPQRRWRRQLRVGSFERPTAGRRQLGHGGRLRSAPPSSHAAPRAAGVPAPTWFAGPLVLHSPLWLTRAARVDGGGVGCNGGSGGSGGPGAVGTRAHHASRRRREPQSQPVYTCVMITSSVRATISSSKLPIRAISSSNWLIAPSALIARYTRIAASACRAHTRCPTSHCRGLLNCAFC